MIVHKSIGIFLSVRYLIAMLNKRLINKYGTLLSREKKIRRNVSFLFT